MACVNKPVVIRISPMAHIAAFFMVLILLLPAFLWPPSTVLMVLPLLASVAIARLRTEADADAVTAHELLGSTRIPWEDIDGLHFVKGKWARARLRDGGRDVRLPAVTFATLPLLTQASRGRVPNPYR
ncbi:PH domain-containing protein [Mycolicibacterium brumae]|uniref:Low molecular weight protein antigen 6 PH domain-containing protein n=2 Tax=Mycolicibacterium brumae TaxID=85968 RepID=A0A2G5P9E2_9MYCO|nr:PH domain-containing protein [Mycolicibacterium brumae]PIB74972.1 hypothetical protein CQY22_011260 [Mycolicibacterium brumae]